jgi:hypothetical protein
MVTSSGQRGRASAPLAGAENSDLHTGRQSLRDKLPQPPLNAVKAIGCHGHIVDQEHQWLDIDADDRRARGLEPIGRAARAAIHERDVPERHGHAVLQHLEVVPLQRRHEPSLAIENDRVELDEFRGDAKRSGRRNPSAAGRTPTTAARRRSSPRS